MPIMRNIQSIQACPTPREATWEPDMDGKGGGGQAELQESEDVPSWTSDEEFTIIDGFSDGPQFLNSIVPSDTLARPNPSQTADEGFYDKYFEAGKNYLGNQGSNSDSFEDLHADRDNLRKSATPTSSSYGFSLGLFSFLGQCCTILLAYIYSIIHAGNQTPTGVIYVIDNAGEPSETTMLADTGSHFNIISRTRVAELGKTSEIKYQPAARMPQMTGIKADDLNQKDIFCYVGA
ncbi:hypothetical protein BDZ45DRAFT_246377 [Acephala macrosclerotiorum]|nr:hypothetical protein BDZ45DRAFT_246377 [Acephala macrosclerotiorum]